MLELLKPQKACDVSHCLHFLRTRASTGVALPRFDRNNQNNQNNNQSKNSAITTTSTVITGDVETYGGTALSRFKEAYSWCLSIALQKHRCQDMASVKKILPGLLVYVNIDMLCLEGYISVISIVVIFQVEWCIRNPWSSFIILHNSSSTAHNHHTNNNNIFLHL